MQQIRVCGALGAGMIAALLVGVGILGAGGRLVPPAAAATGARVDRAAAAPASGSGAWGASVPLASGTPAPTPASFAQAPGSPIEVGHQPAATTSGDFNGDGFTDLASANFSDNTVTVLLGVGQGQYRPAPGSPFPTGLGPSAIVSGRLNNDNFDDLAVANSESNNVTILLANGSGGFTAGTPVPAGSGPHAIDASQINTDNYSDLVVANVLSNNVTVLLADGQGGFTPAPGSPVPVGTNPFAVLLSDVNMDYNDDLLTANYGSNNVSVLRGDGTGRFIAVSGSPFAVGSAPVALDTGPINVAPGYEDLAVANSGDNTVSVLIDNGAGTFTPAPGSPLAVGTFPDAVKFDELNGDFNADLIVANAGSDNVQVLLGNGVGGYQPNPEGPWSTGHRPTALVTDYLNTDRLLDLVVANGGSNDVDIFLNITGQATPTPFATHTPTATRTAAPSPTYPAGGCGSEAFTRAPGAPFPVDNGPQGLVAADFNGDGKPDLASANFGNNDVTVLLGNGSGGFAEAAGSPFAAGSGPRGLVSGDFNHDGHLDLATADFATSRVMVLLGDGHGAFGPAPGAPFPTGAAPPDLVAGDWNGDGNLDLAVPSGTGNNVSIFLGNGSGGFSPAPGSPVPVGSNPLTLTTGDWNHDGKPDLATANLGANTITVLLGNGSGGFSPAPGSPVATGIQPAGITAGDFNGDGNPDLATANTGSANITVLLSNGSGGFSPAPGSPIPAGLGPTGILAADLNGDGHADLAVSNSLGNNVTVLYSNGAGGFNAPAGSPYPAGTTPGRLAAADFNRDGAGDLAVANTESNDVTVLLNNCAPAASPTPTPPGPTATPCGASFSDVHPTDYFYQPVLYLACRGVISGYGDGTFRPYADTTRSQMVKIVVLGFGKPITTPSGGAYTFADVPPAQPFYAVIETAAALNIVSGYTCGRPGEPCDAQHRPYFRPYASVTRGQLSKIDVVAAGWPLRNPPAPGTFEDVLPNSAFYTFVETAACHGIISGYTCGGPGEPCDPAQRPYFRQFANATRGQIAKIVYLSLTTSGVCGP